MLEEKIRFILSVVLIFNIDNEEMIIKRYPKLQLAKVKPYHYPVMKANDEHIVVVGSGPAGLFFVLII